MLLSESEELSVAVKLIEMVEFLLMLMQGDTVAGLAVQVE